MVNDNIQTLINGIAQTGIPGTGIPATPASGKQSVAITTVTTTVVKNGAGSLGTIINAGSAISGVVTIYDNIVASGTLVWSGTLAVGQILVLGIPCALGITIVTAAAAQPLLVTFA